jgi:hypothetical protein
MGVISGLSAHTIHTKELVRREHLVVISTAMLSSHILELNYTSLITGHVHSFESSQDELSWARRRRNLRRK